MAFEIQWNIEGETQLARRLRGISTKSTDFKKPFGRSAGHLVGVFSRDVFATRGAVIGTRWKRLSPATVAQKARLGYPPDPLVRTGAMKKGFRKLVESDRAVIYNNTDYFKYHQSNKPRSRIPRRVMMKLGRNQREAVMKIFHTHLHNAMKP